jgi:Sec-independent protein translocase protein TatA
MGLSIWQVALVALVFIILLFGRGKILASV